MRSPAAEEGPSKAGQPASAELRPRAQLQILTGHAITATGVPLACMPACGAVGLVWPWRGSEAARLGFILR